MCNSCPFNFNSESSEYAQNLGCLPTPHEIIEHHKATGKNWACHITNKLCRGMCDYQDRKDEIVDQSAGLFFEIGVHGSINYSLNKIK